jgi:hypothetical protein
MRIFNLILVLMVIYSSIYAREKVTQDFVVSAVTIKYSESTNTDNALREISPRVFQYSQALILETESFELKEKTYLDC